jgi:hypothetical protein
MELIGKSITISEIKLELKLTNLKILTEKKESFGHNYNLNIKEELKNPLFFN